jgi:hypothetical protein
MQIFADQPILSDCGQIAGQVVTLKLDASSIKLKRVKGALCPGVPP